MDLLASRDIAVQGISPAYLSTLLRMHREEEFDGLFHLTHQEEETLFFLCNGEIKLAFTRTGAHWQPITGAAQDSLLQRIGGDLRIFPCPATALRLIRLYLENLQEIAVEETNCPSERLLPWIENAFQEHGQGLVCFRGHPRQGLILTYPDAKNTVDIAGWNAQSCHTGQMVFNMLRHAQTPFHLTYHPIRTESDAWKEYLLTRAFQNFVQMLFLRFRTLAGQVMTGHVSEQLNILCQRQRWKLEFREGVLFHSHFFRSSQEAEQVYQKLFAALLKSMGIVIGEAFVRQSMQETQKRLAEKERSLLSPLIGNLLQIKLSLEVA
jgi:hypothetical protein